jgi:hypothetical protein
MKSVFQLPVKINLQKHLVLNILLLAYMPVPYHPNEFCKVIFSRTSDSCA